MTAREQPTQAPLTPEQMATAVEYAITSRRSLRRFLPTPVPTALVRRILEVAARAPSGTNTQPWQVRVLTGAAKERLVQRVLAAHNDPAENAAHRDEYDYYPREWKEPFLSRRRKVGWDLYGLLGLDRSNKQGMHDQHGRNYRFFDAPVGLIFTIDRSLGQGSWLDYGMFLQNVMVAARGHGLDTCPQAAFCKFHRLIADELALPPEQMLVCGMSLGYADASAPENQLQTEREPVDEFTVFLED